MAPHKEDSEETPPAETSQQPGDRLQKEQQKELATLDQQDVPDSEMDEKVPQPLLTIGTKLPITSLFCTVVCIYRIACGERE